VIRHVFAIGSSAGDAVTALLAGFRFFVGSWTSHGGSSFGNVNPSTKLHMIGAGVDAGETTLSIMHNDGAGTASKIDLGANFPVDTGNRDLYVVTFFAPPAATYIGYHVRRVNTGDEASGTITSDLPADNGILGPQFWINNASVGGAYRLLVIDTEYVPWSTL
jgi:hypothetical protein